MGRPLGYAGMALIASVAMVLALAPASAAADRPGKGHGSAKVKKPPHGKGKSRKSKPPDELFGIQAFGALTAGELAALRAMRVGTQRIPILWPQIERSAGRRDWRWIDLQFALAARYGIRVLPLLLGTPPHLAPDLHDPPVRSAAALSGWTQFATDAVRRYGPHGEFWQQYPELPHLPPTHWQVWNEPSNTHAWPSAPSGEEYASLVIASAAALRAVDPEAKIVLAGLLPNRGDPYGQPLGSYLRDVYGVRGVKRAFDAVAIHPYAIRPRGALRVARRARKVMRSEGDRKTPLWISELGWATGGVGDRPLVTSFEGQARKLRKAYRLLLGERRRLRLKGIVWLAMRDFDRFQSDWWPFQMGLFTAQKVAKPAWYELARITGGDPAPIVEPPAAPAPPPPPPPPPPPDEDRCFLIFC